MDVKKYTRQAVSNSCKRKATEDLYQKPEKITKVELASCGNKGKLTKDDFKNIRKNMWYARSKTTPPLPNNLEEDEAPLDLSMYHYLK